MQNQDFSSRMESFLKHTGGFFPAYYIMVDAER
jgi:hypothetical protein